MWQRRSAALGLLVLLIAACGGGDDGAAPAATVQPASVEVFVDTPDNGEAVKAKRVLGDRLAGDVTVSGTTGAGAVVVVQATCEEETDCRTSITAGEDGAFEQEVEVWSAVGREQGRLIVGLQGSPPVDRDRLVLLLEAKEPKPEPTPKPKKGKKKDKQQQQQQPAGNLDPVPVPVPPEAIPDVPAAPLPIPDGPTTTVGGPVVMIGDSLAQGTEPLLGPLMGTSVTTDARRGRPLAEGMGVLNRMSLPGGPKILAFSLFTNDSPSNVAALEAAVRTSVQRAGKGGCAIWATIARPPVRGVSYAAANARLNQLGRELGGLRVVPWAETVAGSPGLLGSDRVHGTAAGYRTRAELYAQAAGSC